MNKKPIGRKNYGSIGHLPNSRLGPGDHKITDGQARIATVKKRDKYDRIIVQEKLDGSNVGVALVNNIIHPLSRAGYRAETSPYEQHHMFADWVFKNESRFRDLLTEGERVAGEWLVQAHSTIYNLPHEPFVAFDILVGYERKLYDEFKERIGSLFITPHIVEDNNPITIEESLNRLGSYGFHGALDKIEGAVWRVERKGKVDFLCKYVRPDKKDGIYLPEISGKRTVWNQSKDLDI